MCEPVNRWQHYFLAAAVISSTITLLTIHFTPVEQYAPREIPMWRSRPRAAPDCVKSIHIFADRVHFARPHELQNFRYVIKKHLRVPCLPMGQDCELAFTVGAKLAQMEGKDVVVFGMVGPQWKKKGYHALLEKLMKVDPEPGQTWVYYTTEPPYRTVRWSKSLLVAQMKYHVLMSYNQEADIQLPFGFYRPFSNESDGDEHSVRRTLGEAAYFDVLRRNRSGLITWVSSNCEDVFWPRLPFVARMRELLPFDDYGKCGQKECLPKRSEACKELFASYKFYLAVPNSECDDYITEKFWDYSLRKGSVPVVLGARRRDYEKVAPPNSFIHVGDFQNFQHLANFLTRVGANDDLYAKFHEWRKTGEVKTLFPTPSLFCSVLPLLGTGSHEEVKLIGESPWYRGCREMPDSRIVNSSTEPQLDNWVVWR